MLKICGFPVSSYCKKVKLVVLERGIELEEQAVNPFREVAILHFERDVASVVRRI
ncbi:glutathione S-transferase domain [Methylocaldum marinum]|uniref:Glutathione S-transferase domain n=1 Tax=Methylocaldum marinum TaxID=1432792 RepID=A0A250L0I4_9GAMM|nr:glutathione S-transferase N-terminal domain-containing protein [Methylocaldum marinum]BBA37254.1 glutathione S-transferase domain [Methylocaldum marinum]